ncbi:MAG: YeeE/YedE family protein [Nocardioides sp.]|nr:YeeE/YedE family protein [Nocardioides sp.]
MILLLLTGALAGLALGYVLQRGGLCFHSMFLQGVGGAGTPRFFLLRGWLLGVALASVGLAIVYAGGLGEVGQSLNRGLAFRPVGNIGGGLLIGIGMAVACSCVSGLFHKLGAGMLGALVGLAGWSVGELLASRITLPGPTVLRGGDAATIPGVLGVPRLLVAVLAVMGVVWWRTRSRGDPALDEPHGPTWSGPVLGVALGAVTVAGWLLADLGGASFGPSTVGAIAGIADGRPPWWLIGFLLALVAGGAVAAATTSRLWVRGEQRIRYLQLAGGGVLLGAGGWFAGGCNLGHGLSGAAQLNVSSWVVVAAMASGVAGVTRASRALRDRTG